MTERQAAHSRIKEVERMSDPFKKGPWAGVTTRSGLPAEDVIALLEASLQQGREKAALSAAYEMYLTSPQMLDEAWRRLLSASVGEAGGAEAPQTVCALYEMRKSFDYTEGDQPIFLVYAVRYLCRCEKDRSSSICRDALAARFADGYIPRVPDFSYDMHTVKGREMGRGELHFLEEASRVSPQLDCEWVRKLHDDFVSMCELEKTVSGRPLVDAFLRCSWTY